MDITPAVKDILVSGAGGAVTVGLIALVNWLRKYSSLSKQVSRLLDSMFIIMRTTRTQNKALKVNLVCLRDGKCNGEVKDALEEIDKADEEMHTFLDGAALGQRRR